MRVYIHHKCWNFVFAELDDYRGECDHPDTKGKTITVDSRIDGEERLEVIIHECLHSASFDMSEEWVEQTAIDIARILTRLGYTRRPNNE